MGCHFKTEHLGFSWCAVIQYQKRNGELDFALPRLRGFPKKEMGHAERSFRAEKCRPFPTAISKSPVPDVVTIPNCPYGVMDGTKLAKASLQANGLSRSASSKNREGTATVIVVLGKREGKGTGISLRVAPLANARMTVGLPLANEGDLPWPGFSYGRRLDVGIQYR